MKRNALLISLLFLVSGGLAFIAPDGGGIEKLVQSLQRWNENNPQEKIHLHMDKPYYALGDTIWFKAYLTIGSRHQLSAQSQAMYVELIGEKDTLIQTLKLPIIAGLGMGDFTLDEGLTEGNYRIRAYTQWMRNAGEDYFFDWTFSVGSPGGEGVVAKVDYQYAIEDGKPLVLAQLNYLDDTGNPLSKQDVRYEIFINGKRTYTKERETDEAGNIQVQIDNDAALQTGRVFIKTTLVTEDKRKVIKTFPIKAALSKGDVQFFPEGGTFVNGIAARIGFKAVDINGKGQPIHGVIIDNTGQEIISFKSLHAGMGSFILKPETGKRYRAKVTYSDNSLATFDLPNVQQDGYKLAVYQMNNDSVLIRVMPSAALTRNTQGLGLVVHSGGETIYASTVVTYKPITSVLLPKKSFPTGIAQFTLFDYKNEPICERVAFVRNDDQMKLRIKTAKKVYKSRERVEVSLESADPAGKPVAGSFSISVVDESKVPVEERIENTIFSNLLLTSDLKGYVENPNYYFTAVNDSIDRALDDLMLTQGYRRFSWKEISSAENTVTPHVFKAESLGMEISGKTLTLGRQPLPNAKVTLMSMKGGILRDTITDALGKFSFNDMVLTDSIRFAVQARTEKKGKKVELILDTVPGIRISKNKNLPGAATNIAATLADYLSDIKRQDAIRERMGGLNRVQRLTEVVIRAKKLRESQYTPQGVYRIPEGHSDQTFILENPNGCASLGICLQGRLAAVNFIPTGSARFYPHFFQSGRDGGWKPMQVMVDGRRMESDIDIADIFDNNIIDPTDIGKIEVVRTNIALNSLLGGPTILIITKNGYFRRRFDPSVVNIRPKGFNKVREFYSPKYDFSNTSSQIPDGRSTIYWNANVKTHGLGKATISYFNADGPGTYRVTVEGINAAGELGRTTYNYEVEAAINAYKGPVDQSNELVTSFTNFQKNLPAEKVYLQTDKHFYNTGDTLWFKAYLLDADNLRPSNRSGLLYVELIDDSVEVVRRVSIPVTKGLGWSQIPLPRKIFHEGAYTIRAYTNWMQNFGDDYFFTKRIYLGRPSINTWLVKSQSKITSVNDHDQIAVNMGFTGIANAITGLRDVEVKLFVADNYINKQQLRTTMDGTLIYTNTLKKIADGRNIRLEVRTLNKADGNQVLQIPLRFSRSEKIDLQFMPEGGHLVTGLKSRVGFKAIGEDGRGTDVEGAIYDQSGQKVISFSSLHHGMGSFDIEPRQGEQYVARFSNPEGTSISYKLPFAKSDGHVLRVDNQVDSLKLTILSTDNAFDPDSTYYLVATSGGKVGYIQVVNDNKHSFAIEKSRFPRGVCRISLLKGTAPLCERVVFIDHNDRLSVSIAKDKSSYDNRDRVELLVEVKDKNGILVRGNFSLAVTDDTQSDGDYSRNNSIFTSLLLDADLKGNVEEPEYYFNKEDQEAILALDNLMLTQGWTGYSWREVFAPITPAKFAVEKDFLITGRVTNILNKPVSGAQILISSQKPSFLSTTITDSTGRYLFRDLPDIDTGSFFIQARTSKGKTMNFGAVEINRFQPAETPKIIGDQLLPWYLNTKPEQLNFVKNFAIRNKEVPFTPEGISLDEVRIVRSKVIKGSFNRNGSGNADIAFDEKDVKESGATGLYQFLKQKLPGLHVRYVEQVAALMYNDRYCMIEIDGRSLPDRAMNLEANALRKITPDQLKDGMNQVILGNVIGVEVMYSRQFIRRYFARTAGSDKYIPVQPDTESYLKVRAMGPNKAMRDYAMISITTMNKHSWHVNTKPDYATLRPLPVLRSKEFYTPRYPLKTPDNNVPDLRSTIHWEPNIVTDASGRAIISFYTAGIPGTYSIAVEGTSTEGTIGSGYAKLKVSSNKQSK